MSATILKGITWGHSRGITPLLAASQRFNELFPSVEIQWHKRSLQQFADMPIEKLTSEYDLLIIDHPWVSCAAATNCVLPLEQYLSGAFMQDQLANSIGGSHESYNYGGHQWALAIDAAAPAASYRADLFSKHHQALPQTWDELIGLAKKGKVALPAIPIDMLMNFYMFCIANGGQPFISDEEVISEKIGITALESMRELYQHIDRKFFKFNPIAVAEVMSKTGDYWYCPFAYCYSNYSRTGYADHLLTYTDVVSFNGEKFKTTVGGTGLSISADCKNIEVALSFVEMVCSAKHQRSFYVQHGGQPGHGAAWHDEAANQLTNHFFYNVQPVMDRGYIRPRYNGYLHFQDHAGDPLHEFLLNGGNAINVLQKMNELYQQSIGISKKQLCYE